MEGRVLVVVLEGPGSAHAGMNVGECNACPGSYEYRTSAGEEFLQGILASWLALHQCHCGVAGAGLIPRLNHGHRDVP
eukprot:7672832-Heterocapsa_arctica.AAC.2